MAGKQKFNRQTAWYNATTPCIRTRSKLKLSQRFSTSILRTIHRCTPKFWFMCKQNCVMCHLRCESHQHCSPVLSRPQEDEWTSTPSRAGRAVEGDERKGHALLLGGARPWSFLSECFPWPWPSGRFKTVAIPSAYIPEHLPQSKQTHKQCVWDVNCFKATEIEGFCDDKVRQLCRLKQKDSHWETVICPSG